MGSSTDVPDYTRILILCTSNAPNKKGNIIQTFERAQLLSQITLESCDKDLGLIEQSGGSKNNKKYRLVKKIK